MPCSAAVPVPADTEAATVNASVSRGWAVVDPAASATPLCPNETLPRPRSLA